VEESQWTGRWVAQRLGVQVTTTGSPVGRGVQDLVGLALRRNPRRAHLLVSGVLGKHVPVDPRVVLSTAGELGGLVAPLLAEAGVAPAAVLVVGYAETATALGHEVARTLGATYLHSTRRPARGPQLLGFEEAHSHATSHRLLPRDPGLLAAADAVVLVDDELSTGATALGTIRALHAVRPSEVYVVAALVDLRDDADRARSTELARELGTRIEVVALASGWVDLGEDLPARAAALLATLEPPVPAPSPGGEVGDERVERVDIGWPAEVPEGGRGGFPADAEPAFARAVARAADLLVPRVVGRRVHVLGTEELMYLPQRLGAVLADRLPDAAVTTSSTTRSPVAVVDHPAYAVRSELRFPAHDDPEDGPGERHAYNLADLHLETLVLVVDPAADTAGLEPLLVALGTVARRVLVVGVGAP
jgi:adenine/guanine phosphoribosyltransferase-like PRPP-binding protein